MAGTSQAAAVVSATAVAVLTRTPEATPDSIMGLLRDTARTIADADALQLELGMLDSHKLRVAVETTPHFDGDPGYHVAMMPFLVATGSGYVAPAAVVAPLDEHGEPLGSSARVSVSFAGERGRAHVRCTPQPGETTCVAVGPETAWNSNEPMSWSVRAPKLRVAGQRYPAHAAMYGGPDLEQVLGALDDAGLGGRPLAVQWEWEWASTAYGTTRSGVTFLAHGSGVSTSPFGVIANNKAVGELGWLSAEQQLQVELTNLDGSGISTSPFGVRLINLFGSDDTIVAIDGSGISTSPFGFTSVLLPDEDGLLETLPVSLSDTAPLAGSSNRIPKLARQLNRGGFISPSGRTGGASASEALAPVPDDYLGRSEGDLVIELE